MQRSKLLVLDGEPPSMPAFESSLPTEGYVVTSTSSAGVALELLRNEEFDLVLADLSSSPEDAIEFLRGARGIDSDMLGILICEPAQVALAVSAMSDGAFDYILKPLSSERLLSTLSRAISARNLLLNNLYLQQSVAIYKLSMVSQLTLDADVVLQKITEAGLDQTQTSGCAVLLLSDDGQSLRVAKTCGEHAIAPEGTLINITPVISRWIEQSKQAAAEGLKQGAGKESSVQLSIPGMPYGWSAAMLAGDRFLGVLHFTVKNAGRGVSAKQCEQFQILAGAAASAVEASVMLEQLRSAERRYRGLSESTADIVFRYELHPGHASPT